MNENHIKQLFDKYKEEACSAEEMRMLDEWYLKQADKKTSLSRADVVGAEKSMRIYLQNYTSDKHSISIWPRLALAAALFIVMGFSLYFFTFKKLALTSQNAIAYQGEIAPGSNKAFLILANGQRISLTDAARGELARQAGVKVIKTTDGQLVYENTKSSLSKHITQQENGDILAYNTIETPKGGQYQIILPDGTKVWLNAASSLKYPAVFTGDKRSVELNGEAYFEVKHNARQPFVVKTANQTVEDIGTSFNINSYTDEPSVKTTLIEGSASVNGLVLKPGQQSILKDQALQVVSVDIDGVIAWKKGLFQFDNANIESVMRQVARWYDIDVKYEGKIPTRVFSGKIYKNLNGNQVLDLLTYAKINFRVEPTEGLHKRKTIIITP